MTRFQPVDLAGGLVMMTVPTGTSREHPAGQALTTPVSHRNGRRPAGRGSAAKFNLSSRVVAVLCLAWVTTGRAAAAEDAKGSQDHPRVSRFKGSVIRSYKASEFGQAEVLLETPHRPAHKSRTVEGKLRTIVYDLPSGHETHEVYRSYQTELEKAGFKTLFGCAGARECGEYDFPTYFQDAYGFMGNVRPESVHYLAAQRHAADGDTFVTLYAYFQPASESRAILTVVDSAPLKSGLVTVSAEALARDITTDGRAIVSGVYFATDSGMLKPESEPALKEMAKLLTDHPTLKVFVVGHTDNAGQPAHNLELSQSRAASVANALVTRYHIDPRRLEGRGVGSLAPVAANRTEEGRAKNRRVELVER